jgi:hypothetical protein
MAEKMYILIKDSIDIGHAVLAAAHASLGGYLTFTKAENEHEIPCCDTEMWAEKSFRKVVCKVSDIEFEKSKTYYPDGEYRVMTESGLGGIDVAIVFRPREVWPPFFKSLKLYK